MAGAKIALGSTLGELQQDVAGNAKVTLPQVLEQSGYARFLSENDAGSVLGAAAVISPETDNDYRLRVAQDTILDTETHNYLAQNTGKFNMTATTMTAAWTLAGFQTNAGSSVATTVGLTYGTYAYFPVIGSAILYAETLASFSAQPVSNTIIDFGLFQRGGTNPFAPTDGVYFRLNSAGLFGVVNHNGTETTTAVFAFTYTNAQVYQFIISTHEQETEFWIDGVLYGVIATPVAQGQPFMSAALPYSVRHAIAGGAAGGVMQMLVKDYTVSIGGIQLATAPSTQGSRMFGSYQGLSGGTMGSLANYANSANPVAAVPTNTTAALGSGLGGQFWETVSIAVNTDGIIMSFQVPLATVSVPGRRLALRGIGLMSHVQTVLVGGPYIAQYSLAFGHTNVSLATAESATTKASRRIALASLTQAVTAAQAVSTMVAQPGGSYVYFGDAPVFVNPGEFIQLVTKHIGTVGVSGTVAHVVTAVYGWE